MSPPGGPAPAVVVVGGGVVGWAVARQLARRGAPVRVLDRHAEPREASWAAAGMLAPTAEAGSPGPMLELMLRAGAGYPALCAELERETGLEVGYDATGTLVAALDGDEEEALELRAGWLEAAGHPAARLDAAAARRLEPALAAGVRGALLLAGDHQVDSRRLAAALRASAERAGVASLGGVEVERLVLAGGRAAGVELEGGEVVPAERVVLAAGAWSGRLAGVPSPPPVRPVHGQIAALELPPGRIRHVLRSSRAYLLPRRGRLLVGATSEEIGFSREVTEERARALVEAAAALVPELAGRPVLESWSGLRPATPDGRPILGPDPEVEGLLHATGHFRNGILLGPLTGELIAAEALGETPAVELAPFSPARFR